MKRCARCRVEKPLSAFHPHKTRGTQTYCKACSNAVSREYTAKHPGSRRKTPRTPEQRRKEKQQPRVRTAEQLERKRATQRTYRMANPGKVRMWNKLRVHRLRCGGPMPEPAVIGAMLCEQEALCTYCRRELGQSFHIDHKTPVSRGGSNDDTNLQLLCAACNSDKHARTHEEYVVYLQSVNGVDIDAINHHKLGAVRSG